MSRRRALDFYPTAGWATQDLLARVHIGGYVIEPCAGRLDIANELRGNSRITALMTNDLDPHRPTTMHGDATDLAFWSGFGDRLDWVVSNPPFNVAHKILPLAHKAARRGVAMLLRISYLEPCEGRAGWLAANPPDRLIVLPRISFTGDGKTDNVTCAWFVWTFGTSALSHVEHPIEVVPDPRDVPGALFSDPGDTLVLSHE